MKIIFLKKTMSFKNTFHKSSISIHYLHMGCYYYMIHPIVVVKKLKDIPASGYSRIFARKNGLIYHRKFACNQNPRFSCGYCSYKARHISNTRRHIRKYHPGWHKYGENMYVLQPPSEVRSEVPKRKFPCPNCPTSLSHQRYLTYHLKHECGKGPRFGCGYCSYKARHVSNTRRHIRTRHPGQSIRTINLFKQYVQY
ncbi:RE1-silencing transcription factor B-like [Belonocnema kinseyi]|uniref:RE1-silencing transcription factor B-like n=1 Tax=Belonocnema kinseyi TaxID=2817044 RepID=UPI00143CE3C8|nr:RE1-silencing transcription factor B-like [Belonocnema kinseyi]